MKMIIKINLIIIFISFLTSCNHPKDHQKEIWKQEISDTEQAFAQLAKSEGIAKAFLTYAANDAVLLRNNKIIIGIDSIREMFDKQDRTKVELDWTPDFIDVSASGDLGYTYGKYTYTIYDSDGKETISEGIFHTVWKRQADGNWKFVWE